MGAYLSSYWSYDHLGIISKSNWDIETEFNKLYLAQRDYQASVADGESVDCQRKHEATIKAILDKSIRHYTENCRFLVPGMEVLTGNTALNEVIKEYTNPERRGHSRMTIKIEETGPLGTGSDLYYERGSAILEGPNFYQKNNHMTLRKKVMVEVDGQQVPTFPIDTLIFNEIENCKK